MHFPSIFDWHNIINCFYVNSGHGLMLSSVYFKQNYNKNFDSATANDFP